MRAVGCLALLLWAETLLSVVAQDAGFRESCDDDDDPCMARPGGHGLPLYVGLQPLEEGWAYDLDFFHRDGKPHVRFGLEQSDESVRVDIQYGEYLEKASIFYWPSDRFPLCDWRYFLISEEDGRLQVLFENTTEFTTATLDYALPALEIKFTADRLKVRVNCYPRATGKVSGTNYITPPQKPNESSPGILDITESNTTVHLNGNDSMSTLLINNESMSAYPVYNESMSAYPVNKSMSAYPVNNESMSAYPVNNKSMSADPVNNESMSTYLVNNESFPILELFNESMTTFPVNNESSSTIPLNNESLSTVLLNNESMSTVSVNTESLSTVLWNDEGPSLQEYNITTPVSPANSKSSAIPMINENTLSPSENGSAGIHPKFAEPVEEKAEGSGVSQLPLSEPSHHQHHTTPPPIATVAEPRFTDSNRTSHGSPEVPGDTEDDNQTPKKKGNTVILVVSVIGGLLVCAICALCILFKRRSRRNDFTAGEAAKRPEETVSFQVDREVVPSAR